MGRDCETGGYVVETKVKPRRHRASRRSSHRRRHDRSLSDNESTLYEVRPVSTRYSSSPSDSTSSSSDSRYYLRRRHSRHRSHSRHGKDERSETEGKPGDGGKRRLLAPALGLLGLSAFMPGDYDVKNKSRPSKHRHAHEDEPPYAPFGKQALVSLIATVLGTGLQAQQVFRPSTRTGRHRPNQRYNALTALGTIGSVAATSRGKDKYDHRVTR